MSSIYCALLKSARGLSKGKKTIFPSFCTLGTLWRENCILSGHKQHKMLLQHAGELTWQPAEGERFGTRREPVFRRKQTSLWYYGKKKTFLSKGLSKLRSIDCSWSERQKKKVRGTPCHVRVWQAGKKEFRDLSSKLTEYVLPDRPMISLYKELRFSS